MCIHCNARGRHESRLAHSASWRSIHTRSELSSWKRSFYFSARKKLKRFASSGISGHSNSGRTQTKLNGRGRMSFGPFRRDRRAVRVFAFTSCDSKNYDCLQPPVRKVLAFMLCRLTDVRHAPSEPPANEPLLMEIYVNACEVRPPPAVIPLCMIVMDGVPDKNSLSIVSYEKPSQVFEEKELDKRRLLAQWGLVRLPLVVVVRGVESTTGSAWMMGVQVHTGTRIHWDAHQTFFCTKGRGRGGGESKQILREYGFKKS